MREFYFENSYLINSNELLCGKIFILDTLNFLFKLMCFVPYHFL